MTIYEIKEKKDKKVETMYNKAMRELDKFFKLGWKRNKPVVIILNNRKQIDELWGCKTQSWLIAFAEENKIFLLDQKNYEKESSHKYSDKEYFQLIKHELSHLFFRIVCKNETFKQFIWFNEGVAGFLSGQYKTRPKPEKFDKFINQYSLWNGKAYQESAYAVKLLFDKFGKPKLLNLIKSLKNVKSQKDFNKNFKNIYGSEPTYNFFNKLLK